MCVAVNNILSYMKAEQVCCFTKRCLQDLIICLENVNYPSVLSGLNFVDNQLTPIDFVDSTI